MAQKRLDRANVTVVLEKVDRLEWLERDHVALRWTIARPFAAGKRGKRADVASNRIPSARNGRFSYPWEGEP